MEPSTRFHTQQYVHIMTTRWNLCLSQSEASVSVSKWGEDVQGMTKADD
jgi:hypothetical protein